MFDESEDRKSYENHVIDLGKNGFMTSRMTSQPLNGHTKWNYIFFPHIDVIQIISEHLIGPLEESSSKFSFTKQQCLTTKGDVTSGVCNLNS